MGLTFSQKQVVWLSPSACLVGWVLHQINSLHPPKQMKKKSEHLKKRQGASSPQAEPAPIAFTPLFCMQNKPKPTETYT
jgi:hypothetical protein